MQLHSIGIDLGRHDWLADDACLKPGLGVAEAIPHLQTSDGYGFSSCQVCWRIARWHNGRTRRSPNQQESFKTA
jgi:hypothetical protein